MPVPILCLDDELCHFVERYRQWFSKPQYQYFVIVLLGLMLCEGRRTLTLVGLLQQVAERTSLSGLSRFLAQAPWDTQAVGQQWLRVLSSQDAAAGRSGTGAPAHDAAQTPRSPQATPGDRVSDRG